MKHCLDFLKNNSTIVIFVLIATLALGFRGLDSKRIRDKRSSYADFLKETARPFKVLKSAKDGSQEKADSPDLAALQEYFATMDPVDKRVTAERLPFAYKTMEKWQSNNLKTGGYQLNWTGTDAEMGGRTRAIMWDPNVNNKVWAGGVTGGLWFNNDITSANSNWQAVNDLWDNLAISCITYDPNNPLIMYVGTGEAQTALITYRESSGRGVGIWKSTDGGQSWELLPSTSAFAYVTKMVVRNENGNSVAYAGVVSGYYYGSQQSQPSDGLFRSADGGDTWQQVLPNIVGSNVPYGVSDVALGADGRIYVGTMPNLDGNGGAVVLHSDIGTLGSWTVYDEIASIIPQMLELTLPGRVVLTTSASDANVLYAAISAGIHTPGTQPVYRGEFIIRSNDKGATWVDVLTPNGEDTWANLAWHAMTIGVDPNNPNVLYAGGLDVWRTSNNGISWEHLSDWAQMYYGGGANYVHADQHTIVYKPGSSAKILFGCDGGVFYTQNGNGTTPVFEEKNKQYNTLQFYSGAIHPGVGQNKFIGGLQDNGSLLYEGSPLTINSMISGGDGAYCFWDNDNPDVYFTSVYYNRYYLFKNGMQFNYIDEQSGVFINPADYSSETNTLYANAVDFWGGFSDKLLRVINIPANGYGYFLTLNSGCSSYFSHIKASPHASGIYTTVFAGSATGQLYKIERANSVGETTEIGSPLFPTANISSIAIGGSNDTLLVTFSNYGVSSIWQTYNGGATWNEVEGNLPDMPVRWAIYHPQNSKQALVATEVGVWSTNNLGEGNVIWTPQTSGMANVRVDMLTLRKSDNTVLAASHGRGLFTCKFELDLNTSSPEITEAGSPAFIYVSQNGIEVSSPTRKLSEYSIYSLSGNKVKGGKFSDNTSQTIAIDGIAHGLYMVKVLDGDKTIVKKLVL